MPEFHDHKFVLHIMAFAPCAVFCLLWLREIRRRRRAERLAALRRADLAHGTRLMALGELTGSIVHEINQPLGAILANAEAASLLLRQNPLRVKEVRQILTDIRNDDLRANRIVRQIRGLLTRAELEMAPLAFDELVADTLLLAHGALRAHDIRLTVALAAPSRLVRGDRTQLQQVLMNLLLNAIDAMRDAPPARRELAVQTHSEGGQLVCAVLDRGHGPASAARERAFESFFTTKDDGLGLGLSISKAIIERHCGVIALAARDGGGASASFALPLAPAGAPALRVLAGGMARAGAGR